ncbi:LPXTG cell wall anchor domain-containing protein [Parasphingorhabdus sp.]|uniref:LPXTG cell wall anchor domain-containing protein n=1 Tax=Parasphingorhabdus sp. TaxID=2709688 RepID=UPI002F95DB5F
MTIKYMGRKMRAKTLALVIAGALGVSAALPPSAMGQTVERQLPQTPPPDLPSVSEYSLPPGDQEPPADRNVQGPVEENGPPPKVVTEPDPVRPSSPLVVQPVPTAPTPDTDTGVADSNPRQSLPATRTTTPQQSVDPGTQAETPIDNGLPQADALGQTVQPSPSDQPAAAAAPQTEASASAQEGSQSNSLYYFGGAIFILLLAGLGLYFWRRKTLAGSSEHGLMDDPEPVPAPEPKPVPRRPAPKIYSPPNPAEPKKPSSVSRDGFVISKIGATPSPQPMPKADSSLLRIEFIANGASSTLLNAVLNYSVTLTNISDQDLSNIRLSGTMMQADSQNARNAATQSGDLLHETESLPAGASVTLTGDIRLPLSSIRPITIKSQALFIPLAHFSTEYIDDKGNTHHQGASFIIGREYEPPRAKMAPFRLDLGPRSFGPVGQRPLTSA